MVGADRVAVTKALTKLRKENCIEIVQRYIHVSDQKALQRISRQG